MLNPTYMMPYLPVRPPAREPWNLTHQAVWEADGIIVDTPDFAAWAESIEGIRESSEEFRQALRFLAELSPRRKITPATFFTLPGK